MPDSEQVLSAAELLRRIASAPFSGPLLDVPSSRATRVTDLQERDVSAVLTLLERAYGDFNEVAVTFDGSAFELTIPALERADTWRSAQRLHEIIAFLRSPEGCPWDRAQDWSSLASRALEEAYEVVDAIAGGDPVELAGELGDLLLIVALLTQIAEEQGAFTIEDVYELVNRKLIRRHPHVFGDDAADTPEAVLSTWQRVKREERGPTAEPRGKYDRLPKSMPGIAKAAVMLDGSIFESDGHDLLDGDQLLLIIEGMMAAGRDPEAELQAALDRKYQSN